MDLLELLVNLDRVVSQDHKVPLDLKDHQDLAGPLVTLEW